MKESNVSVVNGKIIGDTDKKIIDVPTFGEPIFTLPDNDTVYDSRWAKDEKNTRTVDVIVPIGSSGISVRTSIYGNLKMKDGDRECSFAAVFPAKALKADSPEMKNRLLAHIENAVLDWPEYGKATEGAYKRLTAPPMAKGEKSTKGTSIDMRPRLVHKPAVTAAVA